MKLDSPPPHSPQWAGGGHRSRPLFRKKGLDKRLSRLAQKQRKVFTLSLSLKNIKLILVFGLLKGKDGAETEHTHKKKENPKFEDAHQSENRINGKGREIRQRAVRKIPQTIASCNENMDGK